MTRSISFYLIALFVAISMSSLICNENFDDLKINQIWIIGSKKTECQGVALQECYWIKKNGTTSDWELYYDQIDGFEYMTGYEYQISVSEETIANPPADASSLKHTLVELISQEMKESEGLPD